MDRPSIDHARRVRPRRAHGQRVSSHSRAQSRRLLGNDASVFPPMASGTRSRRTAEDIRSLGSCSRERDSRRSSQPLSQSLARSLQVLLHLRMAFLSPPFPVGSVTSLPTACTDLGGVVAAGHDSFSRQAASCLSTRAQGRQSARAVSPPPARSRRAQTVPVFLASRRIPRLPHPSLAWAGASRSSPHPGQ